MSDSFAPPAHDGIAVDDADLPSAIDIASDTLRVFLDDLGPFVLVGVGQLVVGMVAAVILLPIAFGCMFGGLFGGALLGGGIASTGQELEAAGAGVSMVGFLLGYAGTLLTIIVGGAILTGPFHGSALRAIDDHMAGVREAGFSGAFDTATRQPVADILVVLGTQVAVIGGVFVFLFGSLVAGFFLHFAPLAVAMDGLGAGAGFRRSIQHASKHASWHLASYGLLIVFALVANYIPVIGPAATTLFTVKLYRAAYPRLDAAPAADEVAPASPDDLPAADDPTEVEAGPRS